MYKRQVFNDADGAPVFQHPAQPQREYPFGQEGGYDRVDSELDVVEFFLFRVVGDLFFDLRIEQRGRRDQSSAVAGRAGFAHVDVRLGTHPLAGDLHQAEFR